MTSKRYKFWSHHNRFRLMLTLGLAILLPAAALIFVNFHHLKSIKRDKNVEALIHRDFQYALAVSEKKLNQKAYTMTEEVRALFPSPDNDTEEEKGRKIDLLLSKHPWLAHLFLFDSEKGLVFRSQPEQMNDKYCREESEGLKEGFGGWFRLDGKVLVEGMHKKSRGFHWYTSPTKRESGEGYITTAFFVLPQVSKDRVVLGGASFDPNYMKKTFFPETLDELIAQKTTQEKAERLAMMVYPAGDEGKHLDKPLVASAGWGQGKPEVTRKLDDVFHGLALGIKFQGTSVDAIGRRWVQQSFLILGVLSLLMIGGLILTYRSVSKEMALAHLKSDFVSNVSHELRTPLALIRLYAETLELGRIKYAGKER